MKKLILFLLFAGMTLSVALAATPSVWMTVEVRGLASFAAQAELLAANFESPLKKDDLLGMLGGALMAPGLPGVDQDGTIRIYVMERADATAPAATPLVAFSLPVAGDGQEYLDAVGTMLKPGETTEGVEVFSADPNMPAMIQNLYVARLNGRLVLAQELETARDLSAALRAGEIQDQNLPVDGTLALSISGVKTAARLAPLLDKITAASANPAAPMDNSKMVKTQFDGYLRLLRQMENLMLGLRANDITVTLSSLVEPAAGSVLERVIGELRAPAAAFSALVPAGALLGAAGHISVPDEFLDAYGEMAGEMYSAMGEPWTALGGVLRETVVQMKGQFLGDYAFALLPGTGSLPVDFIEAFAVKDPTLMQEAMDKVISSMQNVEPSAAQPIGMKLSKGEPREYEGVSVTAYRYDMQFPDEVMKEMPAVFQTWLGHMSYEMAFVGQTMFYTLGSPEAMNRLIDAAKKGDGAPIQQAAPVRALLPDLPETATDIHYFNVMDLVRVVVKAVPEIPPEIVSSLPASPLALAGYSRVEGRNMVSTDRIAQSDLKELGGFFRGLSAKMAPTMMPPDMDSDDEEEMLDEDTSDDEVEEEGVSEDDDEGEKNEEVED